MLKNSHLRRMGRSWSRTRFEPINPSNKFHKCEPDEGNTYVRMVNGHKFPWLCYCVFRHDWLIRTLVKLGVSVEHFMPGSKEVPLAKCLEISRALRRLTKQDRPFEVRDPDMLRQDIKFFAHCGGIRIHNWDAPPEDY